MVASQIIKYSGQRLKQTNKRMCHPSESEKIKQNVVCEYNRKAFSLKKKKGKKKNL